MEDKLFELMTKMYSDITAKLDTMDKKLDSKADKNDVIQLEDKIHNDSKALFDGYKQTYEKLESLETKVDEISSKVEKQDVEIRVIKGGK